MAEAQMRPNKVKNQRLLLSFGCFSGFYSKWLNLLKGSRGFDVQSDRPPSQQLQSLEPVMVLGVIQITRDTQGGGRRSVKNTFCTF
jgi:hypothetical protein